MTESGERDPRWDERRVRWVEGATIREGHDSVAVEKPLEIEVSGRALSVTLRTPGDDAELALGFLAGEGLLRGREDVASLEQRAAACPDEPDRVSIRLAEGVPFDWSRFERHFAATAACGLCGRAHLEALRTGLAPIPPGPPIAFAALQDLPAKLTEHQRTFARTGGLHAAAWVDERGQVAVAREDVGRHNAVDKVVGWLWSRGMLPVGRGLLWVSGRAGTEIVLKALRAQIPALASVSAPSSLAVDLAQAGGLTLVGFLRPGRCNVYTHPERIAV